MTLARTTYRQVARLHIVCINQGFLPQLGESFLSLMYQAIDEAADGILITETEGDRVVGFVSGCVAMRPIYLRMLRRPFHLFVAIAPSLVRPRRLKRILEILRYTNAEAAEVSVPRAELLSIAVEPAFRGKRRADALYLGLKHAFKELGEPAFKITVGEKLAPARSFYTRMGASAIGTETVHAGEKSLVFVQLT